MNFTIKNLIIFQVETELRLLQRMATQKELQVIVDNFIREFVCRVKEIEKSHIRQRLDMTKRNVKNMKDISPELASVFDGVKSNNTKKQRHDVEDEDSVLEGSYARLRT